MNKNRLFSVLLILVFTIFFAGTYGLGRGDVCVSTVTTFVEMNCHHTDFGDQIFTAESSLFLLTYNDNTYQYSGARINKDTNLGFFEYYIFHDIGLGVLYNKDGEVDSSKFILIVDNNIHEFANNNLLNIVFDKDGFIKSVEVLKDILVDEKLQISINTGTKIVVEKKLTIENKNVEENISNLPIAE